MTQPVTLITGATSGIGRSLALRLAARGTRVALIARNSDRLAETAEAMRAVGGSVATYAADVTDSAAIARAVREIEAGFGPIECLVANAGGGRRMPAAEFDSGDFAAMVNLNLGGFANVVAAVLPAMRARGSGQIVAIGSLAARLGLPGAGAYSAAKAGVARLAASLRVELARDDIAVTLIEPGFVNTKARSKTGSRRKPFRMDLEKAITRIERAIDNRSAVVAFPLVLVVLICILRCLPPTVYNWAIQRIAG